MYDSSEDNALPLIYVGGIVVIDIDSNITWNIFQYTL